MEVYKLDLPGYKKILKFRDEIFLFDDDLCLVEFPKSIKIGGNWEIEEKLTQVVNKLVYEDKIIDISDGSIFYANNKFYDIDEDEINYYEIKTLDLLELLDKGSICNTTKKIKKIINSLNDMPPK